MLVKKAGAAQGRHQMTQKGVKFGQFGRKWRWFRRVEHVRLLDGLCVCRKKYKRDKRDKRDKRGGEGKMLEAMGHMRSVKVKNYEKRIRP